MNGTARVADDLVLVGVPRPLGGRWAVAEYPPRIGEIGPVTMIRPVVRRQDERRRPPHGQNGEPPEPRRAPPADGHIIDEYAA